MTVEDGSPCGTESSHLEAERALRALLGDQHLGVLSTHREGAPHASLVAFVASEDLRSLVIATPRATRKFANIIADPRVALLIDNARDYPVDFEKAAAATATGRALELTGHERAEAAERFCARHPLMCEFVASPSTALLGIEVDGYHVVRRFQQVTELHLKR